MTFSVDDENIYYNDLEVFERHCDVAALRDGDNIYHVVEQTSTCNHGVESSADNAEYETCAEMEK